MASVDGALVSPDPFQLRLFVVQESELDAWWHEPNVCSPYWRYYVNSCHGASIRCAGSIVPLPPGAAHLIPAWVRFDLVPPPAPVGHLYVHFDLVGLPGSLLRELFARPLSRPLRGAVGATAEALQRAVRGSRPIVTAAAAKAAVNSALVEVLDALDDAAAARLSTVLSGEARLGPALRRIDAELARPLRVAALARLCGFTEAHFSRCFRAALGQSPAQYVLERRVAAAAQRLVLSDEPIDRIADDCGFPDRFYFSRVFTRRMGVPPAAYRRAQPPTHAPRLPSAR